ncbi:MAG: iron ABC transporter permease [Desulfurococcales archaeon]|nr:iron ABC transporter permease [Desulfurococcales archaeon]
MAGVSVGSTGVSNPLDSIRSLGHGGDPIVIYRLTRTVAAALLGLGLSVSGLTLQYTLRNPMADPYLLGVSSGAAFGVLVLYLFSPTPPPTLVYASGLLWGFIAFLIVIGVGGFIGGGPTSLIVAGVSVGYGFFGLIVLAMAHMPGAQRFSFIWLFGTVAYVTRETLLVTAAIVISGTAGLAAYSQKIYTLILGDEVARASGVDVERLRLVAAFLASSIAASLVALAGPVGFLGLAAPWATRLAIGSNYRRALAGSMILGAGAAVASDLVVRLMSGGGEIPLTAVTALFGAPILFYLSKRTGW